MFSFNYVIKHIKGGLYMGKTKQETLEEKEKRLKEFEDELNIREKKLQESEKALKKNEYKLIEEINYVEMCVEKLKDSLDKRCEGKNFSVCVTCPLRYS